MKLLFNYYKEIQSFNLPFSLMIGFVGSIIADFNVAVFFSTFLVCVLTGGFALSLYYYELRYNEQYYFYFNRGLSKIKLGSFVYGVNLLFVVLILVFKSAVQQ